MIKQYVKRAISYLLCLSLVLGLMPTISLAVEPEGTMNASLWQPVVGGNQNEIQQVGDTVALDQSLMLMLNFGNSNTHGMKASWKVESLGFVPESGGTVKIFWYDDPNFTNGTSRDKLFVDGSYNGIFWLDDFTPNGNDSSGDELAPGTYNVFAWINTGGSEEKTFISEEAFTFTGEGGSSTISKPTITTTSLPNAVKGAAYEAQLQATPSTDGKAITWTAQGLPAGLNLSTDGLITGTPNEIGRYSVTITATETDGGSKNSSLQLEVMEDPITTWEPYVFFPEKSDGSAIIAESSFYIGIRTHQVDASTEVKAVIHYKDLQDAQKTQEVFLIHAPYSNYTAFYSEDVDSLNADASYVEKVVFHVGNMNTEVAVNKAVVNTIKININKGTGNIFDNGLGLVLNVFDAKEECIYQHNLFNSTPSTIFTELTPPEEGISYTYQVTGYSTYSYQDKFYRQIQFANVSTDNDSVNLSLDGTVDTYELTAESGNPELSLGKYTLLWYSDDSETPFASGNSCMIYSGENIYVQVSLNEQDKLLFGEQEKIALSSIQNDKIIVAPMNEHTVTGTVTVTGASAEAVRITAPTGDSTLTDKDGRYELSFRWGSQPFTLTASRAGMRTVEKQNNANEKTVDFNTELASQGLLHIKCPANNLIQRCKVVDEKGKELPSVYNFLNKTIHITDGAVAGKKVKIYLYNYNFLFYTTVTLDNNACADVTSFEKREGYDIYFNLSNNKLSQDCALLLFDDEGFLFSSENIPSGKELHYVHLFEGEYKYLFMLRKDWVELKKNQIGRLEDIPNSLKDGLVRGITLSTYNNTYGKLVNITPPLPNDNEKNPFDLSVSGLTVDADNTSVSVRVNVVPLSKPDKNELKVCLYTNQSGGEGTNPLVISGSLYVNGKRVGDDVEVYPNKEDHKIDFDGVYEILISDIEAYGGYPATITWQSYRTEFDSLEAYAVAGFERDYNGYFVGSQNLYTPGVSLYVPEAVADTSFHIYGYAPAGSSVKLTLDGVDVTTVKANEKSGFYTAKMQIQKPVGPRKYTVQAIATATNGKLAVSNPMILNYNAALPVLSSIEVTNYLGSYNLVWKDGQAYEGYYYYMPDIPMKYRLTFKAANADSFESVSIYLPRAEGVVELKAKNIGGNQWVTDPYLCGNNPPVGGWVHYVPKEQPITLTNEEAKNLMDHFTEGITLTRDNSFLDEVTASLNSVGITDVQWSTGTDQARPISSTYTFNDGRNTYSFKTTEEVITDAAVADKLKKSFPTHEDDKDAIYMKPSDNTLCVKLYENNGIFTMEQVDKVKVGDSGEMIVHQKMTSNLNIETMYYNVGGQKQVLIKKTEALNTIAEPPTNEHPELIYDAGLRKAKIYTEKSQYITDVWTAYFEHLSNAADKVASGTSTRSMVMSKSTRSGALPAPTFTPPVGVNPKASALSLCISILQEHGGEDSNSELFYAVSGNRVTYGGGFINNLKWKVGIENLKAIKSLLDNATGLGKAFAKDELAKWIMEKNANSFFNLLTGNKELDKETRNLIEETIRCLEEKCGDKAKSDIEVLKSLLPKDDKTKDPREKQGGKKPSGEKPNEDDEPGDKPDDGTDDEEDGHKEPLPQTPKPVIDPSGFVYEAVESNRLFGVTATVYEVGTDGTRAEWNAAEYDQINPQTTGPSGGYQWFVTEGNWSVGFSKPGYESYFTGENDGTGAKQIGGENTWAMPVPPVQLDVNIGLISKAAPTVESVSAAPDGVYITFSQYMDVDTLTKDNLILKVNGEEVAPKIVPSIETAPNEKELARLVVLETSLNEEVGVTLEIKANVKNYAGKTMSSNHYSSSLPVVQLEEVKKVTSNVQSGKVSTNTPVTLSCDTEEARIFYTTDGSTPDSSSKLYTIPILITGQLTIKAIAVKPGMKDSKVSTFNYTVDSSVTPTPPPNGGGGGGGSIATSSVSLPKTDNGSISITPQTPKAGDTVKLTPTPEQGYELKELTVIDSKGKSIEVKKGADGSYTFVMPEDNVTVKASFEKLSVKNPFIDVNIGDYFYNAVLWAIENDITKGTSDTTFSPDDSCTRAQIVTFLWRAEGCPEVNTKATFTDVPANSYYAKAVAWAVEKGITKGTSDTTFSPNETCTRAQAVTFLSRALKGSYADSSSFTDIDKNAYYAAAVAWAVENGITNGTSENTFSPDADCTRGQIVTFLYRAMTK